jgi:hypothetical protein
MKERAGSREACAKSNGQQADGATAAAPKTVRRRCHHWPDVLSLNQLVLWKIGNAGNTCTILVRFVKVESGAFARNVMECRSRSPDELPTRIIPTVCARLTGTYKTARKSPVCIAIGAVAASVVAVPVVHFATRKPAPQPSDPGSAITASW